MKGPFKSRRGCIRFAGILLVILLAFAFGHRTYYPDSNGLPIPVSIDPEFFENGVLYFSNDYRVRLTQPIWTKPQNTDLPPLYQFSLRKEIIESRARNNVIYVTFADIQYLDFVLNWVRHLTDVKVTNLLVGALDTDILHALYLEGIPVFYMKEVNTGSQSVETSFEHRTGVQKVKLISKLLSMNFKVAISDPDVVWFKNPTAWFSRRHDADILIASLSLVSAAKGDNLENWEETLFTYDTGAMFILPTAGSVKVVNEWSRSLLADVTVKERDAFNVLARMDYGPTANNRTNTFWAFRGSFKLGIMPVTVFCNGHTYFIQRLYKTVKGGAYMVHPTYNFAGTPGKRMTLRAENLLYGGPEYYEPSNGLISFDMNIPASILSEGEHTLEAHFALVNYQLVRIRSALAVATILDRTLVLPMLWCRFDRMWFAHSGIVPGTHVEQPFVCPLDHIFEFSSMLDELSEEEYGPRIEFREYSFLQNKNLPSRFRKSVSRIETCQLGAENCPLMPNLNNLKNNSLVRIPEMGISKVISDLLGQLSNVQILHFTSMDNVFGGWDSKDKEKKFNNRIARFPGIWCCVFNATPGHIWYDFFNDKRGYEWTPKPPKDSMEDSPRTFLV